MFNTSFIHITHIPHSYPLALVITKPQGYQKIMFKNIFTF